MKKINSIKHSILLVVSTSLLLLASILILIQSVHESKSVYDNTKSLILEQIDLTVEKLDRYRVISQNDYISKTLYSLKKIKSVSILDPNCKVINKRPRNFILDWDCKQELPKNIVLYVADTTISQSDGAPKYILAKIDIDKFSIFDSNGLKVMLLSLFFILCTIFRLNYLMKKQILKPLDHLKKLIGQSGSLKREEKYESLLPVELSPIYEDVIQRDDIIHQNKIELLKQKSIETKNLMGQEYAHNIQSSITILKDYFIKKIDSNQKSSIYLNTVKDLEIVAKQIFRDSIESSQEVNLLGLVNTVIEMKNIEFKGRVPEVDIKLVSLDNDITVSINPMRFKFMLSNIINNCKEAAQYKKRCKINISISANEKEACIKIEDNGRGVEERNLKKLFKRGSSFDKPGGNGLGLFNAKEVMKKENGSIHLSSSLEIGTVVTLKLPIVDAKFKFSGKKPFKNVFIEDYPLNQELWHREALTRGLSLAIFPSPNEFLNNLDEVEKSANIFLDSNFPDFADRGEDWAESLSKRGFKNIFICSSSKIDIKDKPWICGIAIKERPFEIKNCDEAIS